MKLYTFLALPVPIIRSLFTVYSALVYVIQVWRQLSSRTRMELLLEGCLQTRMTYTSAECTRINSWWWAKEVSETCRVSCRSKFGKFVHLVGFIIKKFVTMHGHMNVKEPYHFLKRNSGYSLTWSLLARE